MKYLSFSALLLLSTPARAAQQSVPAVASPVRASVAATSAFGVTHARFFNQLVGLRLDYRFTPRFAFGGLLSYANLEGKDRRAHNVLPEGMLEYRVPLDGESFGIPLRFGLGYLPKNGPTLRIGAGLSLALSERITLEVVPLEPMVWVTRERPELSLDGSVSLQMAF